MGKPRHQVELKQALGNRAAPELFSGACFHSLTVVVLPRKKICFKGLGINTRPWEQGFLEAVVSALYIFFGMSLLAQAFETVPRLIAVGYWFKWLGYFVTIIAAYLVAVRPSIAAYPQIANSDFRFVRGLQKLPLMILGVALFTSSALFLSSLNGSFSPGVLMPYLVGSLAFYPGSYNVFQFYSSAGFARVYLLQFIQERKQSDRYLSLAAGALNQAFNERGLCFKAYDFRAGANLGLMRGTVAPSKLQEIAERVVKMGSRPDKEFLQSVETVLRQGRRGARLLPVRPIRDRLTLENLYQILAVISSAVVLGQVIVSFLGW
jgi:hypothetical protein